MTRTNSAISIAALSAALAAPPAFSFQSADEFSETQTELRVDVGAVLSLGSEHKDDPAFLYDIETEFEFERLTESGRRWGLVAGGRAERDLGRRAWGGRVGDCPAGVADCATVSGAPVSLPGQGGFSGFHTAGPETSDAFRLGIEEAYFYAHTGWGEVRLGYGPGAAQLDAARGPTAFRLSRADNGRVDVTGLSGARTLNVSSGYSPKLVFRSIELGQVSTIGLFRVSASYTPRVRDCGVDVCFREYGAAGLVRPVSDQVVEFAGHYEVRRDAFTLEASFGFSEGSDATDRPGLDGLSTQDAGVKLQHGALQFGARWLRSNNGLASNGSYEAIAVSAGYESGPWLTTIEWAGYSDDFVHSSGSTTQVSASRLIGERWVAGVGVQRSDRSEPVVAPAGRRSVEPEATAVFVELGWRF